MGSEASILAVIQNNPLGALTLNATLDGDLSQAGHTYGLDKFGIGTLIIEGDKLSYIGGTTIQGGTLILRDCSGLGTSSIGDNGSLVFDQATTDCSYDSTIGGIGSLTKTGAYKLTLTGDNTYAGDTTISGGTLSIDSAYLSDTADVTIAGGAMLDLNFTGTDTVRMLYLDGWAASLGTWGAAGSGAEHTSGLLAGTGWLNVTAVPEPGALAMLVGSLAGLAVYAWRKKR